VSVHAAPVLERRAAAITEAELRQRVALATGRRVPVNLTRWLIRTGLAYWTPDGLVPTERTRELAGPMA
jgi:hypothetical protein